MILPLIATLLLIVAPAMEADRAYSEGRYDRAYGIWREQVREQEPDPEGSLLYNLGNCAWRLDRHAEAVLWYRRALLRLPRDGRVRFNLRLAGQPLGISPPDRDSFGAALGELLDLATPGELLLVAALVQTLGLTGLVLLRRRRRGRLVAGLVVVGGLGLALSPIWRTCFPGPPPGVVLERSLDLHREPHGDSDTVLRLRAGQEVRIHRSSRTWMLVERKGTRGWVEREGVGVVD